LPSWKVERTLSTMESEPVDSSSGPQSELALADHARQRLADGLRLPTGLLPALAVAVAVQIGTAAYGISEQSSAGLAVALAGAAVFLGVAALALSRFRRVNGVRVDGLASQVVLASGATSAVAYLGSFAAATWAAFESHWWLVAAAATVGGIGHATGALRWWSAYRQDPAGHVGGASPRMLAALALAACVGFVVLVVVG
jgi:hypothetical protein